MQGSNKMTGLNWSQRQELREMLTEAFSYDADRRYPEDTAREIADSWVPVYYHDIRQEWVNAGCPEPEQGLEYTTGIHHAMQVALSELASEYAVGLIRNADTHAEALEEVQAHEGVPA
jgi:hypothetical protein